MGTYFTLSAKISEISFADSSFSLDNEPRWKGSLETSEMEMRIHCPVCNTPTPHVKVGDHTEKDKDGRAYQRMECCDCGAHMRLYLDSTDEDSQENEQRPPEA